MFLNLTSLKNINKELNCNTEKITKVYKFNVVYAKHHFPEKMEHNLPYNFVKIKKILDTRLCTYTILGERTVFA